MDLEKRLKILGRSARFDLCGDCDKRGNGRVRIEGERWHYPKLSPDGENSIMLRLLMTNRCENNCFYCENRKSNDFRASYITPDEVAAYFANLYHKGRARYLFLSSAISGTVEQTMTRMVESLELIRFRYRIPAYIHTKVLPSASDELVRRTLRLSTRVSVNLEVPNQKRMESIGAPKNFKEDLYGRTSFISKILKDPSLRNKSQTTQFVVGASDETDREFLAMSSHLYNDLNLSRIYFSAFQPPDVQAFGAARTPLRREHRLYQADFLMRKYGFRAEEIPLQNDRNLHLTTDPKTVWANLNPHFFPLEINTATSKALLRIPGLGPVLVKRIIKARRKGKITTRCHLKEIGVRILASGRFLLLDGVQLKECKSIQMKLGIG